MMIRAGLVIGALGLCNCAQPVVFHGPSTLAVRGTPALDTPRVEVRDNTIEIHEKIQFDYDQATIQRASFGLMDEIASVITKNPQIKRLRIEGHASSDGDARHNKRLSVSRSKAVQKYLIAHGISPQELVAAGYGADHPIADNRTQEGREQNRRVEFVILAQDVTHKKVEVDAGTGAEKVLEENHETVHAPEGDTDSHARNKIGQGKQRAKPATTANKKGA
jgi:OmpA family